ncbi:MAG: hypothetical protein V4673_16795 [Pseudomonadota bacterium]
MKIKPVHIGLMIAVVAALALWMSRYRNDASVDTLSASTQPPASTPTAADSRQAALASTPEAQAYRNRMAFEERVRDFLRDAHTLDENARRQQAQAIAREIDQREAARELSAGESVVLRVSLIEAAEQDQAERIRQSQALVERYREQTAARQAAFEEQQRQDAGFQAYKAREAQIVSEVMAMTSYPGGMSRDDYLRMRLQEARQATYGMQGPQPTQ